MRDLIDTKALDLVTLAHTPARRAASSHERTSAPESFAAKRRKVVRNLQTRHRPHFSVYDVAGARVLGELIERVSKLLALVSWGAPNGL